MTRPAPGYQVFMKTPAAETAGRLLFEYLFLGVIPASNARLPAGRQVGNPFGVSGQAGMT